MVNNFPDAEPSTSFGMAIFSNLVAWRVKDEASEDDKSSEVRHILPHTLIYLTQSNTLHIPPLEVKGWDLARLL